MCVYVYIIYKWFWMWQLNGNFWDEKEIERGKVGHREIHGENEGTFYKMLRTKPKQKKNQANNIQPNE